jgi:hypothetical protein
VNNYGNFFTGKWEASFQRTEDRLDSTMYINVSDDLELVDKFFRKDRKNGSLVSIK